MLIIHRRSELNVCDLHFCQTLDLHFAHWLHCSPLGERLRVGIFTSILAAITKIMIAKLHEKRKHKENWNNTVRDSTLEISPWLYTAPSRTAQTYHVSKTWAQDAMTSVDHDDHIEIISFQADSTPVTDPGFITVDCAGGRVAQEDRVRVLPRKDPPATPKQKRIKSLVMVVATTLILMSLILVGVTLSMSDHIDEMGKFALILLPSTWRLSWVTLIRALRDLLIWPLAVHYKPLPILFSVSINLWPGSPKWPRRPMETGNSSD